VYPKKSPKHQVAFFDFESRPAEDGEAESAISGVGIRLGEFSCLTSPPPAVQQAII